MTTVEMDPSDFRYHMGCWVTRRKTCGCIQVICADDDAGRVHGFLEDSVDLNPEHMKVRDAFAEPTFLACPHRTAGFSLIEMLMAVAIIGLLASIAIPRLLGAIDRARLARATSDMRTVAQMLGSWNTENWRPPAALGDLPGLLGSGVPQGLIYRRAQQGGPEGSGEGLVGDPELERWAPPGETVYGWELRTAGEALCLSCPNEQGGIGVPFLWITGQGGGIKQGAIGGPNPNLPGSGGDSLPVVLDPCNRTPPPPGCPP